MLVLYVSKLQSRQHSNRKDLGWCGTNFTLVERIRCDVETANKVFFYGKPNQMHQCLKFIYWSNALHVSDGLSVHHQELKTVHTATGICQTDTADYMLASSRQYLFDICLLQYVQSLTPDDGRKDSAKHVQRYFNKINISH